MAQLILFRHGQSIWNLENKFTGWVDVELSSKGIEEAKNALNGNDIQQSLKVCFEASNILPEIEQSQKILLAIKATALTENDIQNERTAKNRTLIGDIVRQAQRSSGNTVDEASFFIARGLKLQTGKMDKPVLLANFTYQDTKMGSEFSRRLNQALASKLVSEAGVSPEQIV